MNFSQRQIEIIDAVTELISEKGIQNLTTKNLASKMNFSEPALYRHFKSKTEILDSVLSFYQTKMGAEIRVLGNGTNNGFDKIAKLIEFQFDYFSNHPTIVMIIFSETSFQYNSVLSERVLEILNNKRDSIERIILAGQADGSIRNDVTPEQLSPVIMGAMRLTVLQWRLNNFNFDIRKKGLELIRTMEILLRN